MVTQCHAKLNFTKQFLCLLMDSEFMNNNYLKESLTSKQFFGFTIKLIKYGALYNYYGAIRWQRSEQV